jgi:riboflavin transporter FmnP
MAFSASQTSENLVAMSLIVPEVPFRPFPFVLNLSSDVSSVPDAISSLAYSPYLGAVVTIDHENTVKSYSLSPSTLGRGHALLDPGGPVWVN